MEVTDKQGPILRRSRSNDQPEANRRALVEFLTNFADEIQKPDLRAKVVALVPAFRRISDRGISPFPKSDAPAARDRIIAYFLRYPRTMIDADELMVVSGTTKWARRVEDLRVKFGWAILSGETLVQMADDDALESAGIEAALGVHPSNIKTDQYVLTRTVQDRRAPCRWNSLIESRRRDHH